MRNFLAVASVAGLAGITGLVAWTTLNRPQEAFVTGAAAEGFNMTSAPKPFASRPVVEEGLRDAVASPSSLAPVSPRPIADSDYATSGSMPARPAAAAPAAEAKPVVTVSSSILAKVRKSRAFRSLLSKPASMLLSQTSLRSGSEMRRFLADPKRVDAYMNSTMVRVALHNEAFAKAMLTNRTLVRAFLSSPAMEDPAVLRSLLSSPMLKKFLDCPGVQGALADPKVIQSMVGTPEAAEFLTEHPGFLKALGAAAPAMAQAFAR